MFEFPRIWQTVSFTEIDRNLPQFIQNEVGGGGKVNLPLIEPFSGET